MSDTRCAEAITYRPDRHFEPGFNDVYCKCGAHLSHHANRTHETPHEQYINPKVWLCPVNPPREPSLLDIAIGMLR